jgi:hypothetical protein
VTQGWQVGFGIHLGLNTHAVYSIKQVRPADRPSSTQGVQHMMNLKVWLKEQLSPTHYRRFVRFARAALRWRIVRSLVGWCFRNDLNRLALFLGTDKWGAHWYTQHYHRFFEQLKHRQLNVLEIGVGGYESSRLGGASLHMWKAYFRKGRIVAIDIYDKRHLSEHRIDIRQCDQTDSEALTQLSNEYGGFDIIIDDGSHLNDHVIKTFQVLFPLLRQDGIYAVEDTETAYWPTCGGGIGNPRTSMAFFKNVADGINHLEYPIADYSPNYCDQNIVEIAFFHNLIIIRKGKNDENAIRRGSLSKEVA